MIIYRIVIWLFCFVFGLAAVVGEADALVGTRRTLVSTNTIWWNQYAINGTLPSVYLDFAGQRYFDGKGSVPLSSMVSGNPTVTPGSGAAFTSATIQGVGALLAACQLPAKTLVSEIKGATNGVNGGIVAFGIGVDAPLFQTTANNGRNFKNAGAISLDSTASAIWSNDNTIASWMNGAGRAVVINGGLATDANVISSPSVVQIGGDGVGAFILTGFMKNLAIYPRVFTTREMLNVGMPTPFPNSNALVFTNGANVNVGNNLLYDRTQAWSGLVAVNVRGLGNGGVIFTTVSAASGALPGYEMVISSAGNFYVRIIHDNSANQSVYVSANGTNLQDSKWHMLGASYDGSSTAAGVTLYIDGVAQTPTVIQDTLTASSVSTGPFMVGNQTSFLNAEWFPGILGGFQLSNVARNAAYFSSNTLSFPTPDASTVLAYNFTEGSGTTVHDLSSSGFNGTLSSANMWLH